MVLIALLLNAALFAADAPPADEDLVSLGPGDIGKYWTRVGNLMEGVAVKDIGRDAAGCAAVAFIIEKDGTTSAFRLLRDMPPDRFGALARKVVSNLKFEPTERNSQRQAAYTYTTISFRTPDRQGSAHSAPITIDDRLNDLCAVKGLQ